MQLDVIVLDASGRPIRGLKPTDFKILEDGKSQQVRSFDAHEATVTPEVGKPFDLPPHQYTNVPVDEPRGALTVVLFDTLNTPTSDQALARRHMLEFLRELPAGQSTALFTLGTRMRMVQSFTGQSEVLIAAANKVLSSRSPLLTVEAEHQHIEDDLIYRERMIAPAANGGVSGNTQLQTITSSDPLAEATQKLRDALTEQDRINSTQRVGIHPSLDDGTGSHAARVSRPQDRNTRPPIPPPNLRRHCVLTCRTPLPFTSKQKYCP